MNPFDFGIDTMDESLYVAMNKAYNIPPTVAKRVIRICENAKLHVVGVRVAGQGLVPDRSLEDYLKRGGDPSVPVEIHVTLKSMDIESTPEEIMISYLAKRLQADWYSGYMYLIDTVAGKDGYLYALQYNPTFRELLRSELQSQLAR